MTTRTILHGPILALLWPLAGAAGAQPAAATPQNAAPRVWATWEVFRTADGLPDERVTALRLHDGRLWVGTADGLAVRRRGSWQRWTQADGLPWPLISAIDVDPASRDVWLGTWGGGLLRLSGGRFDAFNQFNSGLVSDLVFDVVVAHDRVWAATPSGLSEFDVQAGSWTLHFTRRADDSAPVITSLGAAGQRLYAAAWYGPVLSLDPATRAWGPDDPFGIQGAAAPALRAAERGTLALDVHDAALWRATPRSLQRREGTETEMFSPPPALTRLIHVPRCLQARAGTAWLGTADGLLAVDTNQTATWLRYAPAGGRGMVEAWRGERALGARALPSGIPDLEVRCLAFQGDSVWVGTAAGLARATGPVAWHELRPLDAAADEPARSPGAAAAPGRAPTERQAGATVVRIALLGPAGWTMALPGESAVKTRRSYWPGLTAVQLAVDEVNADARGPATFELITGPQGYERYGWGTQEDDFGHYAVNPEIAGLIGRLRPGDRAARAAAFRSQLPLVNVAADPPTLEEVGHPCIFRCRGDLPLQHAAALRHVLAGIEGPRVLAVRTAPPRADSPLDGLIAAAGTAVLDQVSWTAESTTRDALLARIRELRANVVLTWADPRTSAEMVRTLRGAGHTPIFIGGEQLVAPDFVEGAGDDPGTVWALCSSTAWQEGQAQAFARQHQARFRRPPAADDYLSFRATRHLLAAIRKAGPDRRAVRQALEDMSSSPDGEAACCGFGDEPVPFRLARLQGGRWRFETP